MSIKSFGNLLTNFFSIKLQIIFKEIEPLNFFTTDAYQRKNGSQQRRNAPIIIPSVLAALCSARQLFVCCRIEVPETQK